MMGILSKMMCKQEVEKEIKFQAMKMSQVEQISAW